MTRQLYIILIYVLTACGTTPANPREVELLSDKVDTTDPLENSDNRIAKDKTDDDKSTFFVVIADTSFDYYTLHKKMFDLNKRLKIPIDTMGRFYNKTKNLIALPDHDEDELYAGAYFPRRFPSENLSLEYLDFYQRQAGVKTIALVIGIYETEKSADSTLTDLLNIEEKAFKIKSDIYTGCLH